MTYTCSDLLGSTAGVCAFALFFLPPGYLLASCTRFLQFNTRIWPERLLWSIALSVPISTFLAQAAGRSLHPNLILHGFEAIALAALIRLAFDLKGQSAVYRFAWDRASLSVVGSVTVLILYCLLAPLGIQIHHRLYESSLSQDWAVRIPLVNAAIRGMVPPGNPFFAIQGHPVPLHYYYFWPVLCADVCRLTGIDAKSSLVASCVWAALALVSCIFLSLKYMGLSTTRLRRNCAVSLLVACVLGLDVIPAIIDLLLPRMRFYPDIEFWHADRSPSWLGTIIWAPHHVAGFICCMMGVLVLAVLTPETSLPRKLLHAAIAGAAFSAALGTSTYITGFFILAVALLLAERLWRREWSIASTYAAAGVLSLLLSYPFVRELLAPAAVHAATAGHHHLLQLTLRGNDQARSLVTALLHPKSAFHGSKLDFVLRPPVILALWVAEFGFFLFVIAHRVRVDLIERRMTRPALWTWLLFASFALPGFLLSSAGLQTNNDLGRHAGMCMHFVLILWATPMVEQFLFDRQRAPARSSRQRLYVAVAVATFILGLSAQLWQVVANRIYIPLVDSGRIPSYVVDLRFPHIASRMYDVRQAMEAANRYAAVDAIVQPNPQGRLEPIFELYSNRQMAAGDTGCLAPFGGDSDACAPVAQSIVALFGGSGRRHHGDSNELFHLHYDPAKVTPEAFDAVCREQSLAVVVASYSDPAWNNRQTWVWEKTPVFANSTARVFLCPGSSPSPDAHPQAAQLSRP
jgi:hypothetical protein